MKIVALLLLTSCIAQAQEGEISRKCGGPRQEMSGTIKSPTNPETNQYFPNEYCSWDIPKKEGYKIVINFVTFDLEKRYTDCDDYVSLDHERYCGDEAKDREWIFTNGVTVEFSTDDAIGGSGFELTFKQEKLIECDPPCQNGGTCEENGTCLCSTGYVGYKCSYKIPTSNELIEPNDSPDLLRLQNNCVLYGKKNIRTFDGRFFHMYGSCEYALVEFGSVKVTVTMRESENITKSAIKSIKVVKNEVHTIIVTDGPDEKKIIVTGAGRTLKVPDFYGPYEANVIYQKIHIKDDDFHLEVDEDGSAAKITLSWNKRGTTSGLCGNFNGMSSDDLMTSAGHQATDMKLFEMSWRQDKSCSDSTTNIKIENSELANGICNQMLTAEFSECLDSLYPQSYSDACVEDMRLCNFMENPDCQCASFTQYARDCNALKSLKNLSWRDGRCIKECPATQVYSECAPHCPRTCKSLGMTSDCPDTCTDGCTCEEGFYWDDHKCVPASECSCHVGEVTYESGEIISEPCRTCTCLNGALNCTEITCDGTAVAFGNPHYLTFDGLWYTYDGVCEYTLLEAPREVRILVDSEKCGTESKFTCINHVTITIGLAFVVKLQKTGEVQVSNEDVILPYIIQNIIEIRQITSTYVSVTIIPLKISLKWNPDGIVILNIPKTLQGQVKGMFGNFNGKTTDDFTTRSGIVEQTAVAFGEAWSTDTSCSNIQTEGMGSCILKDEDRQRCYQSVYQNENFLDCSAMTAHEDVIRKFCQESVCAATSEEEKEKNFCDTLSVFATLCAVKGHIIAWRNDSFCPISCSNGKVYEPWTSSCGKTCRGITEEEDCSNTPKAEGCVCPEGLYEAENGECVPQSECGCFYKNKWRPNDDFIVEQDDECYCSAGVVKCSNVTVEKCTGDMVYTKCTGGSNGNCRPTCSNKALICQDCHSGCACPNGTFYQNGACVHEDDCHCVFQNKIYQSGDTVDDDCKHCLCEKGDWICTKTTECSRTCLVTGGSYIKTFDEFRYRSPGTCAYTLMTDNCPTNNDNLNYFEIYFKAHACTGESGSMCNITLHARLGNDVFIITKGQDLVHTNYSTPRAHYYGIKVTKTILGFHTVLEGSTRDYYLQVSYDNKTSIKIEVSRTLTDPEFRGRQICGLCGDMDDSGPNDLTTKNGQTDATSFINSWEKDPNCPDVTHSLQSTCEVKYEAYSRQKCDVIKSDLFKDCHSKIDPDPFYDVCVEETCSCRGAGECECFCSSVKAYADSCGRRGVPVNWRLRTGCPVECEEFTDPTSDLCDIKYYPCKECIKTCCGICLRGCFEGCFPSCDEGMVFNEITGSCMPDSNCTSCENVFTIPVTTAPSEVTTTPICLTECYDDNGVVHPVHATWYEQCNKHTCKLDDYGCTYEVYQEEKCSDLECEDYEELVETDSDECCKQKCQCKECTYEGTKHPVNATWSDGECISLVCEQESCPVAKTTSDKRNQCPDYTQPICSGFYRLTDDNSDPCCPRKNCTCDQSLCPLDPTCTAGMEIDELRSDECCEVYKCLPVCLYNGKEYKNNSVVTSNKCSDEYCRCTSDTCSINTENKVECPESPDECTNYYTAHYPSIFTNDGCCETHKCKCECRVYGDPHYLSFDGYHYMFQGVCQYVLVEQGDLRIIGDNQACDSRMKGVSCLKDVHVVWKGTIVKLLTENKISVDGNLVSDANLPLLVNGISIKKRRSGAIRLKIKEIDLQLDFEYTSRISHTYIVVPMTTFWFNTTRGLCGTCTNTKDDDMITVHENRTDSVFDFATSWEFNSTSKTCNPCSDSDDKDCWNCDDPRWNGDLPEECEPCDKNICNVLYDDIFSNCTIDPTFYYADCEFDESAFPKCSVCDSSAIVTYAERCGHCVKWRNALNCTEACPAGMEYKECVTECDLQRTCDNRGITLDDCVESDFRGCGCPDGLVRKSAHSNECIEERCCSCNYPTCKEYEELVLVEGADLSDCCPSKKCQCKSTTVPECKSPKILIESTDESTPGCPRYECICPEEPNCPDIHKDCNIPGCTKTVHQDDCGCTDQIECKCETSTCPPLKPCGKCEISNPIYPVANESLACSGSCCPEQYCISKQCADVPVPKFPQCPFLTAVVGAYSDVEQCCPSSYDVSCLRENCNVFNIPTSCPESHVLTNMNPKLSSNQTIREYANCDKALECCPYMECVCRSCQFEDSYLPLGESQYRDNGCLKVSCTNEILNKDGCYDVTQSTPTCPDLLKCQCYELLIRSEAPGGAVNDSQWNELCCPKYECATIPCSDNYEPGPDSCPYPAERRVKYETDGSCENRNCPIAECFCDKCVDGNNNTHDIGMKFQGSNECEQFICLLGENICPDGVLEDIQCSPVQCNATYQNVIKTQDADPNSGRCCPTMECSCKPDNELESICSNWKSDNSLCADPVNMVLTKTEMFSGHTCCPEKECICKPEDQLSCVKPLCEGKYKELIQISEANDKQCCAEYECQCNCPDEKCSHNSWEMIPGENCGCECTCNETLCYIQNPKPVCQSYEDLTRMNSTIDEGCCDEYKCICNKELCSPVEPAKCNEFQEQYPWYESYDACCPTENRCRCHSNSSVLEELCGKTLNNTCKAGYERHVSQIRTSVEKGICCDYECSCVSCITEEEEVKEVGSTWTEIKDCKEIHYTCSEKRAQDGCHVITDDERDVPCPYASESDYEKQFCRSFQYAKKVEPQAGCCAEYTCENCSFSTWTCESFTQERFPDKSHSNCPGDCECSDPLSQNQTDYCYKADLCGDYEKAVPIEENESGLWHPDPCCPSYKCVCDKCPSSIVSEDKVKVNTTLCERVITKDTRECCKHYEKDCEEGCTCPIERNCSETQGCHKTEGYKSQCGCVLDVSCECRYDSCPSKQCKKCEMLIETEKEANSDLECFGNCCPDLECVTKPCVTIADIPVQAHCDFVKQEPVFGTDECCPVNKTLSCNHDKCPTTKESCDEGYELIDIKVSESDDPKLLRIADCPMADFCCPQKTCVCKSCHSEIGILKLGGSPTYSDDGCTKYTCNEGTQNADGCYVESIEQPQCGNPPQTECYQNLTTIPAVKGAVKGVNWDALCCPVYIVNEFLCSEDYDAGPDTCIKSAVREVSYEESSSGCKNLNCPMAKCICTKCIDELGIEREVGSMFPSADGCTNYTCRTVQGKECPQVEEIPSTCPVTNCNYTYEVIQVTQESNPSEGICCETEECRCKPPEDLSSACELKTDTTHCPDPKHMELIVIGSSPQQRCCPLQECRCKSPDTAGCDRREDFVCGDDFMTIQTVNVTSDNCCPEFNCVCECGNDECSWPSWTAKNTNPDGCNCECSCDPHKCLNATNCPSYRVPVQVGTYDNGCCPSYECNCSQELCPDKEVVSCGEYEEKYTLNKDPEECCPDDACRCKSKSSLEALGCVETCAEGYTLTYADPGTKCCGTCTCTSCLSPSGKILQIGKSEITYEGECRVTRVCSEKTGEDGCHIPKVVYNETDSCTTRKDYEEYQCLLVEKAVIQPFSYGCCDQFRCVCSTNVTVLQQHCTQYNGADCPAHKESTYAGEDECCPQYDCVCKKCSYTCPDGLKPTMTSTLNPLLDDCCFEYSCQCNECELADGQTISVGAQKIDEIHSGCNVSHVCTRVNNDKCEVTEEDPRKMCQSREQYEAENCKMPYQKAVATTDYLSTNPCCVKYECICNDQCPPSSSLATCSDSQMAVPQGKLANTSDCCDDYTCKCREELELNKICDFPLDYKCEGNGYERERIDSQDACCTNYTCTCNPSEKNCPTYNLTCDLGEEKIDTKEESCCSTYECKCTKCVIDGVEHKVNTSWPDGNCNILTCSETEDVCPTATSRLKYQCEPVDEDDCKARGGEVRGTEETNGCCKECTLCKRVANLQNITQTIDGKECVSAEQIDIGSCQGACSNTVNIDPKTGENLGVCACCEPTLTTNTPLMLCEDGAKPSTIQVVESCKCTNEE